MCRRTILLAALYLALAACGSSATPLEQVAATAERTAEAGTARLSLESTLRGVTGSQGLTSRGEGVVDFGARRGRLTLELPAEMGTGGGLELVYEGTVVYLRSSPAGAGVGTEWVSLDLGRLGQDLSGTDIGQFAQIGSNDPSNTLALLEGTAEGVEELGSEEVRGEETARYRAKVDLRKAADRAGAVRDRRQFEDFLDRFASETIPVEVWIDGEGRTRRLRIDQPVPQAPGRSIAPDAGVVSTIELYDFGVEEPIEAPSPGEVTDLSDQLSGVVDAGTTTTTG